VISADGCAASFLHFFPLKQTLLPVDADAHDT